MYRAMNTTKFVSVMATLRAWYLRALERNTDVIKTPPMAKCGPIEHGQSVGHAVYYPVHKLLNLQILGGRA